MAYTRLVVGKIRNGFLLATLTTLVSACGGGSDATTDAAPAATPTPTSTPTPAPTTVTGVATPDSVAVVTATNAN